MTLVVAQPSFRRNRTRLAGLPAGACPHCRSYGESVTPPTRRSIDPVAPLPGGPSPPEGVDRIGAVNQLRSLQKALCAAPSRSASPYRQGSTVLARLLSCSSSPHRCLAPSRGRTRGRSRLLHHRRRRGRQPLPAQRTSSGRQPRRVSSSPARSGKIPGSETAFSTTTRGRCRSLAQSPWSSSASTPRASRSRARPGMVLFPRTSIRRTPRESIAATCRWRARTVSRSSSRRTTRRPRPGSGRSPSPPPRAASPTSGWATSIPASG